MDIEALHRSWDLQQESYLPDRETRLAAMLDVAEAVAGPRPCVLDLAGGIGSITRRLLARLPDATSVVVDNDPVLLAIAEATFAEDHRVGIVAADLASSSWRAMLDEGRRGFDAVLTATALHWLAPSRVATLYGEVRALLRPGGVFANADHMPDPGLPSLSDRWETAAVDRATQLQRRTGAADWNGWWASLHRHPELADALAQRDVAAPETAAYRGRPESSAWHAAALQDAGYTEAGLWWRAGGDALVIAVNADLSPQATRTVA